jgi:hypothetical protein
VLRASEKYYTMVSGGIKRNLQTLYYLVNSQLQPAVFKAIIINSDNSLVNTFTEIIQNILYGSIRLSAKVRTTVKPLKSSLRVIANSSKPAKLRKKAILKIGQKIFKQLIQCALSALKKHGKKISTHSSIHAGEFETKDDDAY